MKSTLLIMSCYPTELLCRLEYETHCVGRGAMFFQQTIYAALSHAFMAAARQATDYKIDEMVCSSIASRTVSNEGTEMCMIGCKPYARVAIYAGRDLFSYGNQKPCKGFGTKHRADYGKCVMHSASTSIALDKAGMDWTHTEIPFVIGQVTRAEM